MNKLVFHTKGLTFNIRVCNEEKLYNSLNLSKSRIKNWHLIKSYNLPRNIYVLKESEKNKLFLELILDLLDSVFNT